MKLRYGLLALAGLGMAACTSGVEYKMGGKIYSTKDAKVHEFSDLRRGLKIKVYEGDRDRDGNVDFIIIENKEINNLTRILIVDSNLDGFANFQYGDVVDNEGKPGADGVVEHTLNVQAAYRQVTGKTALGPEMKMENLLKMTLDSFKSMSK